MIVSAQAAENNARWCDAVGHTHGGPGEIHEHLWLSRRPMPRFYPNVVTLSAEAGAAVQLAAMRELVNEAQLGAFAVKDSFACLDLVPLGFQVLFEATWLWRDAMVPPPTLVDTGLQWTSIDDPDALSDWEAAWNGSPADPAASPPARIFLPALLSDPDIRCVAAYRDQQVVSGAIANRTGDVVGVSNVFAHEDAERSWAGCLATIITTFPGLPQVGYERGEERAIAETLGFEVVGPLRVWR
jgi:hypothetical protein